MSQIDKSFPYFAARNLATLHITYAISVNSIGRFNDFVIDKFWYTDSDLSFLLQNRLHND